MNDQTNPLSGAVGGNTSTGNPQNIGSQNLAQTGNNLQSQPANLLNSSTLQLKGQNGQAINTQTSTAKPSPVVVKPTDHHLLAVAGISTAIILLVFIITWFTGRRARAYA